MAIQNQGWAYVSGSGASGTPGGADTNIQFNNAGAFGGSADLIWDGSTVVTTDISASINISASAFYGDGSNLTGITASAVNIADGPEYSLQFRYDTPVSGDLSGSADLVWKTATNDLVVTGNVRLHEDYEFYGDIEGAIRFPAQVDEAGGITKGQVVYINGISGQTATVGLAACDDASKMPAFGLAGETAANGAALQVITLGSIKSLNLTALYDQTFAVGDLVYVQTGSGGNAGKLTNVRPTGSGNLLQNMGKVVRDGGGGDGQIKVSGAGRINATPNLDKGYLFVGDDTNCSSQDNTVFISSSANRVGINNTNPQASLHISSSTDNVSLLRVDSQSEADAILFVTGSGRVGIGTSDPGIGGSADTMLDVQGHITIGKSATAYIFSNQDSNTYMKFGGSVPPGVDGIQLVVGGKRMLMLDENVTDPDSVTLGNDAADLIIVSGSLIASGTIESNALTSGRVLLAGTDGVIEDNSDIVYDGSVLKVMSKDGFNGSIYTQTGSFAVLNAAATGYLASVGSDGQISASSDMHTGGILNVAGAANLNDNTTVEGNLAANNGLDVSGAQSNFATAVSITGSSDVGLNVSSTYTGGASILSTGNILAGHTGGGAHTAHMNSDGEISGSAILGGSLGDGTATISAGAASGFTSIDGSGDLTMGTITMTGFSVNGDGETTCDSLDVASLVSISNAGAIAGGTSYSGSSAIEGGSLTVAGNIRCGTDIDMRGAQQISFGTKITGDQTLTAPFYRVYLVDTGTGQHDVTLPAISNTTHGLVLTIKDAAANATANVINITGSALSGDKIDGSVNAKTISSNNGWVTLAAHSASSPPHTWYQIAGK